MSPNDLKHAISNLVSLQKIDSEIYALNEEKAAKPEEIKALDASYEAKKTHMQELEKTSLDIQKKRKEEELTLAGNEENRKKLQTQLYSLKTNKEYQTMLQQIDDSKADASVIEDRILRLFDENDKFKSEVDKEKTVLAQEEKVSNEMKARIQSRVKEIDDRLAQLDAQRRQVLPNIGAKVLAQYERILANRDGLAIVGVGEETCLGCNMQVPPQVINLIKMYERLITCEVCNRILYVPGDIEKI
ncbi:MAG: C4-type zinc ribbon domain-containing protein [Candidatus Omnitrophica bacterium]|nr:C4-type zinc ribbon domain-containing protein [Candidatus Omnitrophota bacterium]